MTSAQADFTGPVKWTLGRKKFCCLCSMQYLWCKNTNFWWGLVLWFLYGHLSLQNCQHGSAFMNSSCRVNGGHGGCLLQLKWCLEKTKSTSAAMLALTWHVTTRCVPSRKAFISGEQQHLLVGKWQHWFACDISSLPFGYWLDIFHVIASSLGDRVHIALLNTWLSIVMMTTHGLQWHIWHWTFQQREPTTCLHECCKLQFCFPQLLIVLGKNMKATWRTSQ